MKTEALITMLTAVGTVTAVTGYFFYLVFAYLLSYLSYYQK